MSKKNWITINKLSDFARNKRFVMLGNVTADPEDGSFRLAAMTEDIYVDRDSRIAFTIGYDQAIIDEEEVDDIIKFHEKN